jgi:hypothetical protein
MARNDCDTTTNDRGDPDPDQEVDLAPVGRLDDQLTEAASSGFGELLATYEALADEDVPESRALTAAAAGIVAAVERAQRADEEDQSRSQQSGASGGVGGSEESTDDGTATPRRGRNRPTS